MTERERIKQIRKNNGMTLEQFGNILGVTGTTVSRIENGKRNVTEQMRKSICREFNINPTWLETGEGDMFISPSNDVIRRLSKILHKDNKLTLTLLDMFEQYTSEDWRALEHVVNKSAEYIKQLESKGTSNERRNNENEEMN